MYTIFGLKLEKCFGRDVELFVFAILIEYVIH